MNFSALKIKLPKKKELKRYQAKRSGGAKPGFTLLEILIAISIFSVIVTALLSLFTSTFSAQRRSLSSISLLNHGSYLAELISRNLRMAKKELGEPPACLSSYGLNYELILEGRGIRFINYEGNCEEFYLEDGYLKIRKSGSVENLTPADVLVESLQFDISGESQDDFSQPKVTFSVKLKAKNEPLAALNFQTTVSQREIDAVY